MLLARSVFVDPMAQFAIGFLGLIVIITIGLGVWVAKNMVKKTPKA